MKYVLYLASASFLLSVCSGLFAVALPQAALLYHMSSEQIGWLATAQPLGYGLGCIVLGQLLQNVSGKVVMLAGALLTAVSILISTQFHTIGPLYAWLFIFGIGLAAFWPFTSAWMLENTTIPKTSVLRWYNVSWTSGAATGMFLAGPLCDNGYLMHCFFLSAVVCVIACIGPLLTPGPTGHLQSGAEEVAGPRLDPIGVSILLAGILANISALGSRVMIVYSYPELNHALNFGAKRMGLFCAIGLCGQLTAFLFGTLYERYLGSRRLYTAMIVSLGAAVFAYGACTNLVILTVAMFVCGVVTAMGFQAAIVAATDWFTSRRTGTTVHEGLVGFAQLLPLLAGWLAQNAKDSGTPTLDALKLPFFVLPVALAGVLVLQLVLVTSSKTRRLLLPQTEVAKPAPVFAASAPATISARLPIIDSK